jgi:cytidine deaminase
MEHKKIELQFEVYDSIKELDDESVKLIHEARKASLHAYAPYSGFKVGAAVMMANGKIVTGNNQENAAYPSGMCAERVAMFSASATYPGMIIKAIAITAHTEDRPLEEPVCPCGSCRQVLSEYEFRQKDNIKVLMAGEGGTVLVAENISLLLPFYFTYEVLKNQ